MNLIKKLALGPCLIAVLGLSACDKVKEVASDAKSWLADDDKESGNSGDATAEVSSVDKKEGQKIIAEESRLVMVEYYSDT